jgi:uncharacterized protein YqeY
MSTDIKSDLMQHIKAAMKEANKARLTALRAITAEVKQVEVDERTDVDHERFIKLLEKMKKQRQDSIAQYLDAGRDDLVAQEEAELSVIAEFLPEPLSAQELQNLVAQAIADTGAKTVKDIGAVMALLHPKTFGRASSKDLGTLIRQSLNASE